MMKIFINAFLILLFTASIGACNPFKVTDPSDPKPNPESLSPPQASGDGASEKHTSYKMEITEGLELCKEFQEILEAPENVDYITEWDSSLSPDDPRVEQRRAAWHPIVIPERFKNFRWPKWEDVSDEEANAKLSHIIQRRNEDHKYGIDYRFKKTKIDLDRDGVADVIYERVGYHPRFGMELGPSSLQEYFARHSREYDFLFIYKGKPYFGTAGGIPFRATELAIIEPFTTKTTREFYLQSVCQYQPVFE